MFFSNETFVQFERVMKEVESAGKATDSRDPEKRLSLAVNTLNNVDSLILSIRKLKNFILSQPWKTSFLPLLSKLFVFEWTL